MATVISDTKKRKLLGEFHQFFNLTFKSWGDHINSFSHNKTWDLYQNTSANTILDRYNETSYQPEREGLCTRVIDGDTLILDSNERIRLVGINTPEKGIKGADVSTKVLEKLCLNKNFGLNIDSQKNKDKYGRTLAVIIVNNKNINEILLKEGLAEIMYIPPSEFNPYDWIDESPSNIESDSVLSTNLENQFVNVVIPLEQICSPNYGVYPYLKYFNDDFSNVIFTDSQDFNTIYECESYKQTFFIRVDPINILSDDLTINISLHLVPKKYDCTSELLIFKDDCDFLSKKGLSLEYDTQAEYYKRHKEYILNNYQEEIETNPINTYFQSGLNGQNRSDREHINDNDYPMFDKFTNKDYKYHDYNENNEWIEEVWDDKYDIFAEFDCNISNYTGGLRNLQIDTKYKYNESSPTNAIHYIGTKDISSYNIADRCSLIDANLDNIIPNKTTTNYISQFEEIDNSVQFPITLSPVQQENSYTHNHTDNIGINHYKTIKYFNDRLYSEEKSIDENSEIINEGYTIGDWQDWEQ